MGQVELEFEGSEDFLKEDLPILLTTVAELYNSNSETGVFSVDAEVIESDNPPTRKHKNTLMWSTTTIASKLGVKSGKELVVAACAHLHFELSMESFSRNQVLEEMKKATGYYQQNYSKNLSRYFGQLIKDGALIESAKQTYALSASKLNALESSLDR